MSFDSSAQPFGSANEPSPYSPPGEGEKKGHGCFFYGCLTVSVIAVLMVLVVGAGGYWAYRKLVSEAVKYTDTTPTPFPKVELPKEEVKSLDERVKTFTEAVKEGKNGGTLVLNSDELNALIAEKGEVKDMVQVTIDGDKVKGRVSIPLDKLGFSQFSSRLKGRYLNGMASFKVVLEDGVLLITIQELEVKGKMIPDQALASLRGKNLAEELYKDPDNRKYIDRLESVVVKDGKIVIKTRAARSDEKDEEQGKSAGDATKADAKEESKGEEKPDTKAEPKPEEKPDAKAEPKSDEKPDAKPAPADAGKVEEKAAA